MIAFECVRFLIGPHNEIHGWIWFTCHSKYYSPEDIDRGGNLELGSMIFNILIRIEIINCW